LSDGSVAERPLRPSTQGSLAGAPEREEKRMTVPNSGPQQPDPTDAGGAGTRRGNPAFVHRDELAAGSMEAASTRAIALSHRFGGVRHALTRTDRFPPAEPYPRDGGDPDASH
jgi:hypothetical protein